MTEMTPFWIGRHFRSGHLKRYEKQQASHQNNKMQLQRVGDGPQGQDELTRPQNILFGKEGVGQVAGFREKLTQCQAITTTVSR
jgi:hypothetical protein